MTHDDLVGYALGALEPAEAARVQAHLEREPALQEEMERIRRHMDLHGSVPVLVPAPALWQGIRARLDAPVPETNRPVPFLRRFWMPAAAAALVAAALFWPRPGAAATVVHGTATRAADGTWRCSTVSRLRLPGGATVTMDADTVLALPAPERLALRAGRVFLEVPPQRRGFRVETATVTVETLGTAFDVGMEGPSTAVAVESGRVRCVLAGSAVEIEAGEVLRVDGDRSTRGKAGPFRDWFRRPTLTARILAPDRVRIVLRNAMPDSIELAPPTGGEPLFFATFGNGHSYPLAAPPGSALGSATVTLAPGAEVAADLPLPRPLPDGETLFVTCRAGGPRVEAHR
jgi:ferric-dicitrate binding protein FerR (iron transport regulator)